MCLVYLINFSSIYSQVNVQPCMESALITSERDKEPRARRHTCAARTRLDKAEEGRERDRIKLNALLTSARVLGSHRFPYCVLVVFS